VSSWIALLARRPHLRRLWLSAIVSLIGDWLSFVTVAVLSLEASEGPLVLVGTLAVHQLPAALLGAFAGTIADRVDRRALLVAANLAQMALTLAAVLAAGHSVLALQGLVLVRSGVAAFLIPAETAALRRVVDPDELGDANALFATTWSFAFVIGMASGGALATLGAGWALGLDALTFLFAAAMAFGLPAMVPEREIPATYSLVGELREALSLARQEPRLRPLLLAKLPPALAWGAAWLALHLVAEARTPFGPAAVSIGILQAARGAGTGVGPIVASRWQKTGTSEARLLSAALAILLVAVAVFVCAERAPVLLVAAFVWGSGSGASWVLSSTALSRLAGDARIGRLSSLDELVNVLSMQLSAFVTALLVMAGFSPLAAAAPLLVGAALVGGFNLRALSRAAG
jgi:MFS family permease